MGREMCKLFYGFGTLVVLISLMLVWKTATQMVPDVGLEASAFYLGMSVLFLVIGIVILIIGRHTSKKLDAKERAQQDQA